MSERPLPTIAPWEGAPDAEDPAYLRWACKLVAYRPEFFASTPRQALGTFVAASAIAELTTSGRCERSSATWTQLQSRALYAPCSLTPLITREELLRITSAVVERLLPNPRLLSSQRAVFTLLDGQASGTCVELDVEPLEPACWIAVRLGVSTDRGDSAGRVVERAYDDVAPQRRRSWERPSRAFGPSLPEPASIQIFDQVRADLIPVVPAG